MTYRFSTEIMVRLDVQNGVVPCGNRKKEREYMNFSEKQSLNAGYGDIPESNKYKYDVAVSYDAQSKELVKKVVTFLKSENFEVFFDIDRKSELLSENLEAKLYQVYQNESLVKVLFVTDKYLKNEYTLLEARRSFISAKDNHRRLIIINFMGKELPEPYSDFAYLDGSLPADEIAYAVGERIRELKKECGSRVKAAESRPDTKIYIENINSIGKNDGIVAGNNASFRNISIHK